MYTVRTQGLHALEFFVTMKPFFAAMNGKTGPTVVRSDSDVIIYTIEGGTEYQRFISLLIKLDVSYTHAT